MKAFQRILAVLLCLVMSLGMISMVASAADVFTDATTGSITIHKYELNGTADGPAPGTTTAVPNGAKPLTGVKFTAYQIVDTATLKAYLDGTADDATEAKITEIISDVNTAKFTEDGVEKNYVTENKKYSYTVYDINGNQVNGTVQETTAVKNDDEVIIDATATFNLPVGLYVICETYAPDKVVTPATPFLVSLPMTVNNEWLYNIHVYPKNSTSEGNVTINKVGVDGTRNAQGELVKTPLSGVTFKLEKTDDTEWEDQIQTTTGSGTVTWSSLTQGTYTITETGAPAGYIVDDRPISFTVTTTNEITCDDARASWDEASKTLTLNLVNEKPTLDKEITANENVASVGETVSYSLTTTVPKNIGEMDTYIITDVPKGLSVVDTTEKPITVTVADVGVLAETTNYTKTINPDGRFTLTFKPETMTNCAGKTLTITYDATVTTDAVDVATGKNANEAPNVATLTYSDHLVAEGTEDTSDNEVTKLYQATINKTLQNKPADVTLDGIKFKLYEVATDGTALKFTLEDGTYTLDPNGEVTELVTDTDGKIVINGLGDKAYYLEETETKTGYNLLSGRVQLTKNGDFQYQTNIVNKQGFNLPATGGIGTLMFIIIGGVLMAGGICLIVPNKKRAI